MKDLFPGAEDRETAAVAKAEVVRRAFFFVGRWFLGKGGGEKSGGRWGSLGKAWPKTLSPSPAR